VKGSDLKRSPETLTNPKKSEESYRTGGTYLNQGNVAKSRTKKYANRGKIARHRRDTTQLEHTRRISGKTERQQVIHGLRTKPGFARPFSNASRHACVANLFQLLHGGADGGARRIARSLSANRKVCSAHRERKEDIRSALPGPSAENATGSENKSRFPADVRLCLGFASSAIRARPVAQVGRRSDSSFGVRGTTWLRSSASPVVHARQP